MVGSVPCPACVSWRLPDRRVEAAVNDRALRNLPFGAVILRDLGGSGGNRLGYLTTPLESCIISVVTDAGGSC